MPAGRPTDYRKEYNEQAFMLCLLGLTDVELSKHFSVHVGTLNAWKVKHPKFHESILDGREKADAHVANSLYHKAKSGDTRAAELWLRNRQSDRWRDKQVHEHEVKKVTINVITGIEGGVGSESDDSGSV